MLPYIPARILVDLIPQPAQTQLNATHIALLAANAIFAMEIAFM